eukprot:TRINITY_DN71825_c1_g1_i1.p3 TRINITY_DN71825_c1_g1~~TRINITY_DN71825_c1_g1_i1.p3  ORF type:complete len:357 (-),score=56.41 TRINITY_DN71825_c1_g1_i1:1506-2576(-)
MLFCNQIISKTRQTKMNTTPKMNSFNELFKCAANIKAAQLAEKRKNFDKQPHFIQSGLYFHDKLKEVRSQPVFQQLLASEALKAEGKQEFNKGEYEIALQKFEEALSVFRYITPSNAKWREEAIEDTNLTYTDYCGESKEEQEKIKAVKVLCYLNISACCLKLKDAKNAIDASCEALKLDPYNVKAMYCIFLGQKCRYRKAKAEIMKANFSDDTGYSKALKDLEQALKIEPQNEDIREEYKKVRQQLEKSTNNEKKILKGFLANSVYAEPVKETRAEIDKINSMIAENVAAVEMLEKIHKPRRAAKCKNNIKKLEKMKEELMNSKTPNIEEITKEIKELAQKQGQFFVKLFIEMQD